MPSHQLIRAADARWRRRDPLGGEAQGCLDMTRWLILGVTQYDNNKDDSAGDLKTHIRWFSLSTNIAMVTPGTAARCNQTSIHGERMAMHLHILAVPLGIGR